MEQRLRDILISQAKPKGMCKENFMELSDCADIGEAIGLYKRTIDWALENQYPSLDVLRKYFSGCGKYGVFVDKTFKGETVNSQPVLVFHNCDGVINVEMNEDNVFIPMLYFANGCRMRVVCNQTYPLQIRFPLYIFGDNHIIANDDTNAAFIRYQMKTL